MEELEIVVETVESEKTETSNNESYFKSSYSDMEYASDLIKYCSK